MIAATAGTTMPASARSPAAYEAAAGGVVPGLRLWDLWAVAESHSYVDTWMPNYRDLGRTDLTAAELRRRHASWTARRLAAAPDPDPEAEPGPGPGTARPQSHCASP